MNLAPHVPTVNFVQRLSIDISPVSGRVQLVDINVEPDNMRFMRALNVHCAEPEGLSFYIRVEILQL